MQPVAKFIQCGEPDIKKVAFHMGSDLFVSVKVSLEGHVGSENNLTKCTINTKVVKCLDNQDYSSRL